MRRTQYTMTSGFIHDHAIALCQRFFRLKDHGPKCTAVTILTLLFYAAARRTSLAATCGSLADVPSDSALHKALLATLPHTHELQRRINRALQGDLPRVLRRRRQPLAIDLTLLPYHGLPHADLNEIYRSEAKSGTTHFHAYATAYVMRKGQRFTVALAYVRSGDTMPDLIKQLLRQAAQAGVRPRFLLLDRGFYSVSVIRYLQAARYPFVMPVPCKGRKADHPKGPGGTRVFHLRKRGGWFRYTVTSGAGRKATLSIGVTCRKERKGRRPSAVCRTLVYGYWGLHPSSGRWLYETYRKRFGIESSYRQLREARIRTCTRDPLLRLLYVGIALILRNVWVWLHWEVMARCRRGGRVIDLNQLPFGVMLAWLVQLTEKLFEPWDAIFVERPIPT